MEKTQKQQFGSETIDITLNDDDFDIIEIQHSAIRFVNSYSMSLDRMSTVICTDSGIVIVSNLTLNFSCYLNESGPFWLENRGKQLDNQQLAVKIASLVQGRNEVAVVPNFDSKNMKSFQSTHVYIFDYQLKCILYSVDFFLPISQLAITSTHIYVSNAKRVVCYNYLNDSHQTKNQCYYIKSYQSKKPNNSIRYFQTMCEDYNDPFTINEIIEVIKNEECFCGKFKISAKKPFVLLFIKTFTLNGQRNKSLCLYMEKYDKEYQFDVTLDEKPFDFAISEDGEFIAFTTNYGRNIKVYSLKDNVLYCVLYLGRSISEILKMEFFRAKIEGKDSLCLGTIRRKESTATLHIFKIQKKTPTDQVQSQYKRYFSLFEQTFKDYEISENLISPGLYMHNNILYVFSLCGIVFDAIDFSRSGNRDKKQLENFNRWGELGKQSD